MPHTNPIFHLEIREIDANQGLFSVFAQGAKDEEKNVQFIQDKNFTDSVKRLHLRDASRILNLHQQVKVCTSIGEQLFNSFFIGRVLERFEAYRNSIRKDSHRLRVALRIPPKLYHLPWEVIRDPSEPKGQFLSLQGSLIRYDADLPNPKTTLFDHQISTSADFLFLLSNPQDHPTFLNDFELIGNPPIKILGIEPATFNNFETALSKNPKGLIFFGHGTITDDYGVLIFVKQDRSGAVLRKLSDPRQGLSICTVIGDRHMQMACFLACESAWADNRIAFGKSITGSILEGTQVAFVIGAQNEIDYYASQVFLEALIEALESGLSLDLAVGKARALTLAANYGGTAKYSALDWWIPVLYAKTENFDIFPRNTEQAALPQTLSREDLALKSIDRTLPAPIRVNDFFNALKSKINNFF